MNPTVSIIVPVYNAQKYIRRCVDSITGQEFTDYELILIDDGSTDESGLICDQYAAADDRIRVIHKENSGVSATRNLGLDEARGTYIQFLDSDDWITPDATRLLVRNAEEKKCDMVIADFYRVVGERISQKGDIEEDTVLSREEFSSHMMENPADFYYGVIWNKLYKKEIIDKWNLRMDETISWCEDFMFNLEYIRHAETFYALRVPIYYYIKTKGSLVTQGMSITNTIRMKLMVFEYYNNFYKHVFTEEDYEKNRLQVYRFLVDAASDGIVPPSLLPGTKKLGDERSLISPDAIAGEGVQMDLYRSQKLLQYCLESVALKHDLTLYDITLLSWLSHTHSACTRKELSSLTGMSRTTLSRSLQKLLQRKLIRTEEIRAEKSSRKITIQILPAAEGILRDLSAAENDYDHIRFGGFSEEELIQYATLTEKIKENIQKVLQ